MTEAELAAAKQATVDEFEKIMSMDGDVNAHMLHKELSDLMLRYCFVERINKNLEFCYEEIKKILKKWDHIGLTDKGRWANQEAMFVRQLRNMIIYAMAICKAALMRNESRGAHFKEEYPNRDDEHFLKTTLVHINPETCEPIIEYIDFDHSLVKPRPRRYDITKGGKK